MEIEYGRGKTPSGPGVSIQLTGNEVARAIDAWLVAKGVCVKGPRTITVNGEICDHAEICVDPAGYVSVNGDHWSGCGTENQMSNPEPQAKENP